MGPSGQAITSPPIFSYRNGTQIAPGMIERSRLVLQTVKRGGMKERDETTERRRHQRLELEAEVMVRTDNVLLPGRTQEISDAGMSAILPVELQEGEMVELQIKLHGTSATTHAIVRDRNIFRHGFEFLQPLHGRGARSPLGANDCEVCGATGLILRALDGERGIAFASLTCIACEGTGHTNE